VHGVGGAPVLFGCKGVVDVSSTTCKIRYVLTIVPYQSQECPQFREVDRDGPVPHCPYLLGVGGDPVSTSCCSNAHLEGLSEKVADV